MTRSAALFALVSTFGLATAAHAQAEEAPTEAQLLASYGETGDATLLLRIAEARRAAGDGPGAAEALERYLAVAPEAEDAARAKSELEALRAAPATLELRSTPEGAEVQLDGAPRGQTPLTVDVPPGAHALRLTLDGHEPTEDALVLPFGSRRALEYTLTPSPDAAPEPVAEEPAPAPVEETRGGHRGAIIATASIAAAGIVAGTALGFAALSTQADYDEHPTAARADRGEGLALGADLGFAVGAAAGITALVLYFVDERADPSTSVARGPALRLVGASAGLGLGGSLDF
jgi:hypothetical protein